MLANYDPAIPKYEALDYGPYDMVVSNDVLEHLDPEELDDDLELLRNLSSKYIFLNISCREAKAVLPDGQNAHTIIMTPEEWIMRLSNAWPDFKLINKFQNMANQNVCLLYEKIER